MRRRCTATWPFCDALPKLREVAGNSGGDVHGREPSAGVIIAAHCSAPALRWSASASVSNTIMSGIVRTGLFDSSASYRLA